MSGRIALFAVVFLTGCATAPSCPPPEIIRITETERVPVPSSLTGPCVVDCGEVVTNGDLLTCYQAQRLALAECDARMRELSLLK